MDLALVVLRLVVGLLFVGHGAQKLFGVFGGGGLEGTAGMFDNIGLRPGWLHARVAGTAEFLGGALLALGLFTPFAAAALIAVMTAAVITVHAPNGIWNTKQGYEFNLVMVSGGLRPRRHRRGQLVARQRLQLRSPRDRLGTGDSRRRRDRRAGRGLSGRTGEHHERTRLGKHGFAIRSRRSSGRPAQVAAARPLTNAAAWRR